MVKHESFYLGHLGNSSSETKYCFKYGMAESKCAKKRIRGHTGFNKLTEKIMHYTVRDGIVEEKKFKYFITELFSGHKRIHFFDKSEFFYADRCKKETFKDFIEFIKKMRTEFLDFSENLDDNIVN